MKRGMKRGMKKDMRTKKERDMIRLIYFTVTQTRVLPVIVFELSFIYFIDQ